MQGHGEYELSATGRQQAEKLAQRLVAEAWWPSHVYSSPLKRTVQTTQILLQHFQALPLLGTPLPAAVSDLIDATMDTTAVVPPETLTMDSGCSIPVEFMEELKEFQNGIFQGLTWAEAMQSYPEFCKALEASPAWIQIPQAEPLQAARSRANSFIQHLLNHHQNGDHIWIVSHSWIMQHLIAELLGCDRSWRLRANNTALFEFWLDRDLWATSDQNRFNTDLWQIRRFNDCQHLH